MQSVPNGTANAREGHPPCCATPSSGRMLATMPTPRLCLSTLLLSTALSLSAADHVKVDAGTLEGTTNADSSVRIFKGVPFAAPPVGNLRWQAPQPVPHWDGVRKADEFGPHCTQLSVFNDIIFRNKTMARTASTSPSGLRRSRRRPSCRSMSGTTAGGFAAGAGDEPRYDGEFFAKKGIVVVNVNYRLGVFGFLAHPELTRSRPIRPPATTACSTRWPRCSGCRRTSRRSAAIRRR